MDRGGQVLSKSLWTTLPTLVRSDNIAPVAKGYVATIGDEGNTSRMPRVRPCLMSLTTDVLLRQEPDDEDDEQDEEDEDNEGDDDEEGDDNEDDDGYSE